MELKYVLVPLAILFLLILYYTPEVRQADHSEILDSRPLLEKIKDIKKVRLMKDDRPFYKSDESLNEYYTMLPGYYRDPAVLKSFDLGYDVNGFPYNDLVVLNKREGSRRFIDLSQIDKESKPAWRLKDQFKDPRYIGYPFNFNGFRWK